MSELKNEEQKTRVNLILSQRDMEDLKSGKEIVRNEHEIQFRVRANYCYLDSCYIDTTSDLENF